MNITIYTKHADYKRNKERALELLIYFFGPVKHQTVATLYRKDDDRLACENWERLLFEVTQHIDMSNRAFDCIHEYEWDEARIVFAGGANFNPNSSPYRTRCFVSLIEIQDVNLAVQYKLSMA